MGFADSFFEGVGKILQVEERHLKKLSKTKEWQDSKMLLINNEIKNLEKKAKSGHLPSQQALARIYDGELAHFSKIIFQKKEGELLERHESPSLISDKNKEKIRNPKKAFFWTRLLADSGDETYQIYLANLYKEGIGGNAKDALKYYKKMYEEGKRVAMSIAYMYHSDEYGMKNYKLAAEWYQLAIKDEEVGSFTWSESKYTLGWLYYEGKGVQKNNAKAKKLFKEVYDADTTNYWGCLAKNVLDEIK